MDLLKSSMADNSGDSPSPSVRLRQQTGRRLIGMDHEDRDLWPLRHLGASLPGVYQNYLLVRPYPSLRITFTSPSLRIPGMAQSRLMTRIGGPNHVRSAILEAFQEGVSVTAKISWLSSSSTTDETAASQSGKPRWIHCTPLLGADYRVGVWMIGQCPCSGGTEQRLTNHTVLVEQEEITGSLNPHQQMRQPQRITTSAGSAYSRGPSTNDHHAQAKLYAQHLRGMQPHYEAPIRKDSLRSRTMDESRSVDRGTYAHDPR